MKLALNTGYFRPTTSQGAAHQSIHNEKFLKGASSLSFYPFESVHFGASAPRTPEQLKLFLSAQKAIQEKANLNKPFEHPLFTLLTLAVRLQDLETVQLLLSAQANPNERTTGTPQPATSTSPVANNFADTPVHAAARLGSIPILKALHASGGDVNAKGAAQKTPLHVAASEGKKEAVEWLLKQDGVSKAALDADGNSPQALAMAKKHWDTLQLFSDNQAPDSASSSLSSSPESIQNPPDDWGGLPVDDYFKQLLGTPQPSPDVLQRVKTILNRSIIPQEAFQKPDFLDQALLSCNLEMIQSVLDVAPPDRLSRPQAQLLIQRIFNLTVAQEDKLKIFKTLLTKTLKGTDFIGANVPDEKALKLVPWLFFQKHLLVDAVTEKGTPLLHLLLEEGHIPTLKFFLQQGMSPNHLTKKGDLPLVALLLNPNSKLELVQCLIQGGAKFPETTPPSLTLDESNPELTPQSRDKTFLQLANRLIHSTQLSDPTTLLAIQWLQQMGATINARNLSNDWANPTELQKAVALKPLTTSFLKAQKNFWDGVDDKGNTLVFDAIQSQDTTRLKMLLEIGANPNKLNQKGQAPIEKSVLKRQQHLTDLLLAHGAHHTKMSSALAQWYKDHDKMDPNSEGSKAFLSILPNLLLNEPLSDLGPLFKNVENFYDYNSSKYGYHPNEAELLLLAKHPDAFVPSSSPSGYWNGNPTSALTTALTSISHFINQGVQLSDTALRAWGEIGFLSHGFRFWRYDTVGGPNSLMAQFGFKPFAQDRPLDDVFGKGFIYENKGKDALIEFRRGYLLVSQKDHGTLIIRNSSTVFGRDLLRHPGYFMDKALSREEIETFDPRTLPDSKSILEKELYKGEGSPYIYGGGAHKPSVNDKHLWELVNTILEVKDQYRRYKFDTEAFTETPDDVSEVLGTQPETPSKRFVGHLSPGFPKLVKLLNSLKEQNKPLPDLAFVHPEYPIYQPYTFGEDASGTPQNRYRLTPSHLKELNDFLNGTWSEKKYPDSTWIQFLNQAGVEKRAELVMLAPED